MSTQQFPFNFDELKKIIENYNDKQLAWLSGYLWGRAEKSSVEQVLPSTTPPSNMTQAEQKVTIISASQTGNARRVANELSQDIERLGIAVTHLPAGEYKAKKLSQEEILILVTSTQGEGEPPEEALSLYKYLFAAKAPKLTHLQFAVFGLGDASYPKFCQAAKDFDQRFAELDAQRLLVRVDADTDFQTISTSWRQAVIDKLSQLQLSNTQSPTENSTSIAVNSSLYHRDNPFIATVNVNQKITSRDSDRDIRHIELDLSDSNLHYQPGDAVGVWYQNSNELVEEILSITQLAGETPVEHHGQQIALKTVLTEYVELTQNTPIIIEKYAQAVQHPELLTLIGDREALLEMSQTLPLVDMLNRYRGKIEVQTFVELLRPLIPRFYSIASAQDEVGSEVHLTVNVVRYQVDDKIRMGGASGFLANQIADQDQVKIFIEHNDNFRLPDDTHAPIIMIAAGTGIAPFRAFLQQRASQGATGKNWLFFGNPHFISDFLYQVEWQSYVKEGLLTHIDLAWSRDQAEKIYVQDKLIAQASDIWQWLQEGAFIYVCGDAKRMAKAVDLALQQILMTQAQYSQEQAISYLDELRSQKRYQRDVY
ncbi:MULTISPECIES: assimilatory sulfite reductase (NADPH) flavoprotein subunit [unclassified Gilliamella]|uniref:assimilatory sulfite reductase (NADPH) flavoprotein subunit n=1 Tax=unclassified Gilliamella TaxID=2685620 RepID=UPI002269FEF7|nr:MULTISPECIES: assimilatory sulfite reductase (NADPH) flavoprotein subunit [unclassified Gilliamella]MCX8597462.1 assimilatory sulfite reductase (NADPH) flavoprotein subunit [Gilliamella sp. B3493]MCX8599755.1 assimilatory sulfite reductase (NADPH) flavoprotein subunit [Gilliamella sp. B3486]MCX8690030.1 assimilatory sulfite reductase (NADPH) flavoprotein subunit [Gilliamella sp. B2973]MCX8705753.1 assimilatory sulfite reductase (NADPH) flavoprotein subunit [Gilliamella sp. B3127]